MGVVRRVARSAAPPAGVLAAAAVLAVLAAAAPWLTWHAASLPLSHHLPSLPGLTGRESRRLILDVVICAGWACWAVFLIDVVFETVRQIRHLPGLARGQAGAGRAARLRERAAGLSPPRALAALLAGAILLGLIAALRGISRPPGSTLTRWPPHATAAAAAGPAARRAQGPLAAPGRRAAAAPPARQAGARIRPADRRYRRPGPDRRYRWPANRACRPGGHAVRGCAG